MAAGNPFQQLSNLYQKPALIPGEVSQVRHLTKDDKTLLHRIGLTATQVKRDLQQDTQIFYDRYNLYHHVERSLEHSLVGAAMELYANYCCLTEDTKIPLLDGRVLTIKEILQEYQKGIENWVYSCDSNGKPQPSKIIHAVKQKHTPKTFRVRLDNGKYVDASDNHKFIKRDGTLCRADELEVGDSLMPFHRSVDPKFMNGYERIYDVEKGNWSSTYKVVAEYINDIDLKKANKGKSIVEAKGSHLVVHHKDFNKKNNNPDNLEIMTATKHLKLHTEVMKERWQDPEWREMMIQKNRESHNTPEYLEVHSKRGLEMWSRPEAEVRRAELVERAKTREHSPEERAKINRNKRSKTYEDIYGDKADEQKEKRRQGIQKALREGKGHLSEHVLKICVICGNEFDICPSQAKRKTCGPVCGDALRHLPNAERVALVPSNNHKIVKIEYIGEKEVYDIEVSGSHLFGLDVGIYISNTVFSPLHNATIWITSESPTYQRELTKLLDRIGIEEKIFDWAFTSGSYGDMFVKINGIPGQGVISVDDSDHPINISRVDHEGILIGYYKSPLGQSGDQQKLMAPWEYVHFRLLGGKKQRPRFGDQNYSEFRTVHLLTGLRSKQVTTRYGTSLLLNALPIYRRLRLAEDSLLLARLSRGLIRYIWKLRVDSTNMEAVGELMDQYSRVLREARALDTREGSASFDSKENPMAAIEDIFIPVWGDVGDLTYDKIGGEADIRWIKDIEDLRQQLAAALRTPLPLLGAWLKEATGPLGSQAIEKADINFARMARKLQRTVRMGVKRICQIHLAYMNMDPDPNLFDVQMPEMSTAEEESLKESLRDGTEVVGSIMDIVDKVVEGDDRELDKIEIFNYCNEKFLKLEDFDLKDFVVANKALPECKRRKDRMAKEQQIKKLLEDAMKGEKSNRTYPKPVLWDTDLVSYVPTRTYKDGVLDEKASAKLSIGGGWLGVQRSKHAWETLFGNTTVAEGTFDADVETKGQLVLPFEKDE